MIKLIVGLGNPGIEYNSTRHNAGFWFIDALAHQTGASLSIHKTFHGHAVHTHVAGQDVWLLKPLTFMNCSGQSVVSLARFYKIPPKKILIVHDELDLPPGSIKLKNGGGSGGHNGIKDISVHLSTTEYWRLRFGIGHPRSLQPPRGQQQVADFVMDPPKKSEKEAIDDAISRSLYAINLIVKGEIEKSMTYLHSSPVIRDKLKTKTTTHAINTRLANTN